ncbi:hypothetical protein LPJ81_006223, partial [Coemansia sp. IMI 209127]
MQVSIIGLKEPAGPATSPGANRKPVPPTRMRTPTKLTFPKVAASALAPATSPGANRKPFPPTRMRLPTMLTTPKAGASSKAFATLPSAVTKLEVPTYPRTRTHTTPALTQAAAKSTAPAYTTRQNTQPQAQHTTALALPSIALGQSSSSRIPGQAICAPSNIIRPWDSKRPLLPRRVNNSPAARRHPAGTAASTSGRIVAASAKGTSTFPSSTLSQKPECKLTTGSQEPRYRAQSYARQSGGAATASTKPDAGGSAFTFRVSGKPNAERNINSNSNKIDEKDGLRCRAATVDRISLSAMRNQDLPLGNKDRAEELRARRLAREEDERE